MLTIPRLLLLALLAIGLSKDASAQGEWSVEQSVRYFGKTFQESDTGVVRIINHGYYDRIITAHVVLPGFTVVGDSVMTLPPQDTIELLIAYDGINYPRTNSTLRLTDGRESDQVSLQGGSSPALTEIIVAPDVEFGAVLPGETAGRAIGVRNLSGKKVTIKSITFEKGKASEFTQKNPLKLPFVLDTGKMLWALRIEFKNPYADLRRMTDRLLIELELEQDSRKFTRKINLSAGSLDCIELPRQLTMGGSGTYQWLGGSVIDSLKVTNPQATPLTINRLDVNESYSSFTLLTPFPLTIAPLDSTYVKFRWDAVGVSSQTITGELDLGDCGKEPFALNALYAIRLFEDENKLLNFDDVADRSPYPNFTFYNDATNPIRINSARFAKDDDVNVHRNNFPRLLDPGAMTEIEFSFSASSEVLDDTLLLEIDSRPEPLRFPLHAILRGFSAVQRNTASPAVTLSPNPSYNKFAVRVTGGSVSAIVVTDMLGRIVETPRPGQSTWDASFASPGSYLIRVEGITDEGARFVRTLRAIKE